MSKRCLPGTMSMKSSSIWYSFLIGMSPIIFLVLITNVMDTDSLETLANKILSFVPDETNQETILSTTSVNHNVAKLHQSQKEKAFIKIDQDDSVHETTKVIETTVHPISTSTNTQKLDDKSLIDKSNNSNSYMSNNNNNNIRNSSMENKGQVHAIDQNIDQLRYEYQRDAYNYYKALKLADALRARDLVIHDGGSIQKEAIDTYQNAIQLLSMHREKLHSQEEQQQREKDESIKHLLVSAYCNLGKQYFMANMFELSVESHTKALDLQGDYIDALNARASARIILGEFDDAGNDYIRVLDLDQGRLLPEVFTGLAKVLVAKEDAISSGWECMVPILNESIPNQEKLINQLLLTDDSQENSRAKSIVVNKLKIMHFAMFSYHDHKTLDTEKAWYHLNVAQQYKMSMLPSFNFILEQRKVDTLIQVFNAEFWPKGVGSSSQVPIFIIGFPRSGSTLLERVLDSHSQIAGTGEDSIFNGMLDEIRNAIVKASMQQSNVAIQQVVEHYTNVIDSLLLERWQNIEQHSLNGVQNTVETPKRFVDKMLTNYANVGFIHLLYPNALILHVIRDPMDTIFSAYKHEFPPGNLDYTSDFSSLAQMYKNYRRTMEHWDIVLPGRVKHIKYEDMVHDMEKIAHEVISATNLPWESDVLNFHKKKQTVNTLSTAQVRRGVYRDSLQSWKRYEKYLQPLVSMIGSYVKHDFVTFLGNSMQYTK